MNREKKFKLKYRLVITIFFFALYRILAFVQNLSWKFYGNLGLSGESMMIFLKHTDSSSFKGIVEYLFYRPPPEEKITRLKFINQSEGTFTCLLW